MCYFPSWDHLPTDGPTAQLMCNPNTAQFAYRQVFLFSSTCFVLEICVCTWISTNSRGTRERTYVQMDDACTVKPMQSIYEYGTSQSLCHFRSAFFSSCTTYSAFPEVLPQYTGFPWRRREIRLLDVRHLIETSKLPAWNSLKYSKFGWLLSSLQLISELLFLSLEWKLKQYSFAAMQTQSDWPPGAGLVRDLILSTREEQ